MVGGGQQRGRDHGDQVVVEGTRTGEGGILSGHLHEICRGGGEPKDGEKALPHNEIRVGPRQHGQGQTKGGVGWFTRQDAFHGHTTCEGELSAEEDVPGVVFFYRRREGGKELCGEGI